MAAKYWTSLCFHSIGDWFQNTIAVINWPPPSNFQFPLEKRVQYFEAIIFLTLHSEYCIIFWIWARNLSALKYYDIYRYINLCLKFTEWDPNFVLTLRDCMYLNFFLMCFFSEFMNSSRLWLYARGSISKPCLPAILKCSTRK